LNDGHIDGRHADARLDRIDPPELGTLERKIAHVENGKAVALQICWSGAPAKPTLPHSRNQKRTRSAYEIWRSGHGSPLAFGRGQRIFHRWIGDGEQQAFLSDELQFLTDDRHDPRDGAHFR